MRKYHKGVIFFPIDTDHLFNKRIKLLFNDHDSDGYWIWMNIICYAYRCNGYYFPATQDDIDALSADCRKSPELVEKVIKTCVKRGLFVESIFNQFNVLTSDRMQVVFLRTTYDLRRKGSKVYFNEDFFALTTQDLDNFSAKFMVNCVFEKSGKQVFETMISENPIPGNQPLFQEKRTISTENAPDSLEKVDLSVHKEKKRKEKKREIQSKSHCADFQSGAAGTVSVQKSSSVFGDNGVKKIAAKKEKKVAPKKEKKPVETRVFNDIKIFWWEWYRGRNNGQNPKFDAGSGSAIQKLSKFFVYSAKSLGFVEEDSIVCEAGKQFKHILENWENLKGNKFLYSSVDIKKINSNINDIQNFLQNGKHAYQPASSQNGKGNSKSAGAEQLAEILRAEISTHAR